jgi:hypothetical protein
MPSYTVGPLPTGLSQVQGYSRLSTTFPTVKEMLDLQDASNIWLAPVIDRIDCSGTPGPCRITVSGEELRVYMKTTHLLNPIQWMKGYYGKANRLNRKIADPWNQAYIDAVSCYLVGSLYSRGLSPHFNRFYGAFTATAAKYSYNLTDDFDSYRQNKWFWSGQKIGLYKLSVLNEDPSGSVPEDILKDVFTEFYDSESSDDSEESDEDEEYDEDEDEDEEEEESESVVSEVLSAESVDFDAASLQSEEMSDTSFASDSSMEGEYKILCDISNNPVMLIITEENRGTMDALLDDFTEVGASPGSAEWELRWSAWIFQIIAALSAVQELIGLTHNDLHTNNIVWSSTQEEFLYYTMRDGTAFKIPTFGKIFRIIDFGRAIFTLNRKLFVSDDFRSQNDAGGQYRFKPLYKNVKNPIVPNPSFDLSRLSVSLFQALFPETPTIHDSGAVLSSEEGLTVLKTVSPLYNTLWKWLIDDDGMNVLIDPDGSERYPDFYLYKHIAAHVHTAIPKYQFLEPAFDRFQVNPSEVGKSWSLFC